jgi:predicted NUDIX family NTP pyrophosphohydrolase
MTRARAGWFIVNDHRPKAVASTRPIYHKLDETIRGHVA